MFYCIMISNNTRTYYLQLLLTLLGGLSLKLSSQIKNWLDIHSNY